MRVYDFNATGVMNGLISYIQEQSEKRGFTKLGIRVSNTVESIVTLALCCRAIGNENVLALVMNDGDENTENIKGLCEKLKVKYDTVDISIINKSLFTDGKSIDNETEEEINSRVVTSVTWVWAKMNGCGLCGALSYSDLTIGNFTKDEFISYDFNPIGKLTSMELVEVGKELTEIPAELLDISKYQLKCGVTHSDIHKYINSISIPIETWYKIRDIERGIEDAEMHKHQKEVYKVPEELIFRD